MTSGVYRHSEEHKRKVSEKLKGRKLTEEHKKKIGQSLIGRILSKESRKKISNSLTGKHLSAEHKLKILLTTPRGKKHWNWRGGMIYLYADNWTETLRQAIRERDNYICQICGRTQIIELEELERKLTIHHIDYDKKNCDPKNLITLCCRCHTNTTNDRTFWINYFKSHANKKRSFV